MWRGKLKPLDADTYLCTVSGVELPFLTAHRLLCLVDVTKMVVMMNQCFRWCWEALTQHQGCPSNPHPALRLVGWMWKRLGRGHSEAADPTGQSHILCHVTSCSSLESKRKMGRFSLLRYNFSQTNFYTLHGPKSEVAAGNHLLMGGRE